MGFIDVHVAIKLAYGAFAEFPWQLERQEVIRCRILLEVDIMDSTGA